MAKLLPEVALFDTADAPNGVTDLNAQTIATEGNRAMAAGHKVPLGFGHMIADDSQPAAGWVVPGSLRARGTKVYGSIQLTDAGQNACADGSFRSLSIEVLRGVTINGESYTSLLDRVALLGSAPPAVRTLSDMQALAASRHADAAFAFSATFEMPPDDGPTREQFAALADQRDRLICERDNLKRDLGESRRKTEAECKRANDAAAELDALRAQVAEAEFSRAANELVACGRLSPAQRDAFTKRRKDPVTRLAFTRETLETMALPVGQRHGFAPGEVHTKVMTVDGQRADSPVVELRAATLARQAQQAALGIKEDFIQSSIEAARARPDLTGPMFEQLFRRRSNGR